MKKLIIVLSIGLSSISYAQKKDKVLLTIDNEKIHVSDFKRVYEKNLDAIDNEEAKDVAKNLDLFINYKLKLKEAYAIHLDTLKSYQNELETYRNQLSAPYMQDSMYIKKLMNDAYFRTKNELKAKHILIRLPNVPTPKDTLEAYNKITEIRNRIVNGEDFEKVAVETSEDNSAQGDPNSGREGNKGNLGYFSAFKMVFPFEDAAYNTKVGEISEPFRTRFGYHIIKVDEMRDSKGEIEAAHILIKGTDERAENQINEIYTKLENDEQFKALAIKYSEDPGSKPQGGKLKPFGTGIMVKEFEDAAFSLEKEGEYTKPFKTRFGWHIIQLLKKIPIPSFKEMEAELKSKIRSSDRAQLSEKAVAEKLKKKYKIVENVGAKNILDSTNIRTMPKESLQTTILTINDKKIMQEKFVEYIKNKKNLPVFELFDMFKEEEILTYYKDNLEKSEPEFANTLQEYRDGLLLFELLQEKIWEKSAKDSLGLKSFFDANIAKYKTNDLSKIKGEVMNDYQTYLDEKWVADLRRKSVIEINKKELKKLKKEYGKE